MTRPVWRIASPSSPVSSVRVSTRSPTPGISAGRALRGIWMRMRGASPCASVSHSVGTAISSPSGVALGDVGEHHGGQRAGVVQLLAPPLRPCPRRRARAACCLQRGAVVVLQPEGARDLAHAGLALVRADEGEEVLAGGEAAGLLGASLFQDNGKLGALRRVRQLRSFGRRHALARGLAFFFGAAVFFGFASAFATAGFATRAASALRGALRRGAGLAPVFSARASISATASSSVISSGLLVVRDRRVDAAVGDVRAVAALLDQDRAAALRVIAERAARIGRRSGGPCRGLRSSRRSA